MEKTVSALAQKILAYLASDPHNLHILIVQPTREEHDRKASLLVHALQERGVHVTFVSRAKSADEVAAIAKTERANAIGFGISQDEHLDTVAGISASLRSIGMGGTKLFAGGQISAYAASVLRQEGVKNFAPPPPTSNAATQRADYSDKVESLEKLVDACGCLPPKDKKEAIEALEQPLAEFVKSEVAYGIIENAALGKIGKETAREIHEEVKALRPILGAQLLFLFYDTARSNKPESIKLLLFDILTRREFFEDIKKPDTEIASSLVYEMRWTQKVSRLADPRIFEERVVRFLNRAGSESASEWLNSWATTENFEVLINPSVTSDATLDVIGGSAKVASDLSYVAGTLGIELTPEFLGYLTTFDVAARAARLFHILQVGGLEMTGTRMIGSTSKAALDARSDFAMIAVGETNGIQPIQVQTRLAGGTSMYLMFKPAKTAVEKTAMIKHLRTEDLRSTAALEWEDELSKRKRLAKESVTREAEPETKIKFTLSKGSATHTAGYELPRHMSAILGTPASLSRAGAKDAMPYSHAKILTTTLAAQIGNAPTATPPAKIRSLLVVPLTTSDGKNTGKPAMASLNASKVATTNRVVHPVAEKGLKAPMPNLIHMSILDSALEIIRKFNANRHEKNVQKLLDSSTDYTSRLKLEASKFGIEIKSAKLRNYYEALGIKQTTDQRAIREAYIGMVKRHHPDVSRERGAEEITKAINEAYAILGDTDLRARYDTDISGGKNRISAEAAKSIYGELLGRYMELRDADVKSFNARVSVPQHIDELRAAIEDFADWKRRFDRAAKATFRDTREYVNRLKRLRSINIKLTRRERDPAKLAKLRENGKRLDELLQAYQEIDKGIAALVKSIKGEIGAKEGKIAETLRKSI